MKCKRCHNDLIFYLEGQLDPPRAAQVEKHLEECPSCRDFAALLRETLSVVAAERNPETSPFFYTRVKARLSHSSGVADRPLWARWLQPAFFTLLLLLGIFSGIKIGQLPQASHHSRLTSEELVPGFNEMKAEPIETFLME